MQEQEIRVSFERELYRSAAYDGEKRIGECDFTVEEDGSWTITHTEVDSAYGGRGLAGKLVDAVAGQAKAEGVRIRPECSYASARLGKSDVFRELLI